MSSRHIKIQIENYDIEKLSVAIVTLLSRSTLILTIIYFSDKTNVNECPVITTEIPQKKKINLFWQLWKQDKRVKDKTGSEFVLSTDNDNVYL